MKDRLRQVTLQVDLTVNENILNQGLVSKGNDKRLLALLTIKQKVEIEVEASTIPSSRFYNIAQKYLKEQDKDCKWQAFITIGFFIETKPEECWQLIIEFGNSKDNDTRVAVATVLLEHYFEQNSYLFDVKFRELKRKIKDGNKNLLKTLSYCRPEWGSDANYNVVDRFIQKFIKRI